MPLKSTDPQTTHNLPVIPLRGIVPFPGMTLPLLVGRPSTLAALEEAQQKDRMVLMVAQRDEDI
ncbi:MAG: LON peptidase substrate-binding domain-containing protein, partial [Abditibacteriaceae bacterium]